MRLFFFNQLRLWAVTITLVLLTGGLSALAIGVGQANTAQRHIAYITQPDALIDLYTLYLHDVEVGARIPLVKDYLGWGSALAWSPDGERIAFSAFEQGSVRRNIYVLDMTDFSITQITGDTVVTDHNSPSWSPDGMQLVYHAVTPATQGNIDLYTYTFITGEQTRIYARDFGDYTPRWSPDGTTIAFESSGPPHFVPTIHLLNLETGQAAPINDTPISAVNPAWSPDGDTLVYAARPLSPPSATFELYVMDVNGRNVRRITSLNTANALEPDWSPDGRTLVYTQFSGTRRNEQTRLYTIRADGGGHPRPLTPLGEAARQGVWRP